jgi:CDP-glucose 4,6-dehydratase
MMTTFSEAYRGKRVLVTGLTGFKGQWLGRWLKQAGAEVCGFGLEPIAAPDGSLPKFRPYFDAAILDVRDASAVSRYINLVQPEIVFHLAAQPLVRQSFAEPVETFATNVMGTVHVLDAARRCPSVHTVVNVTSDKCYENREWHWAYREDEAMGGYDPYSASKGCSELVTSAFRRSYAVDSQLGIASGRAGNVIGGADWSCDRLIPDIVRAVLKDQPVIIRRPESIRPWQHVLEAVCGYMQLGVALMHHQDAYSCGWNFGPSEADAVPVRILAREMIEHWGRGEIIEEPVVTGPHEARYLKLDSSKAHAELGWKALLSMRERIGWTIDWYSSWSQSPERASAMMDQQIEMYDERWQKWISQHRFSSPASPAALVRPSRAA